MKNVKMGRFYAMMLAAVVCVGCSEAVSEPAERNAAAAASAWTEDIEGAFKTAAAAKNASPTAQSHQNPKGRILTFPYLFYEHRISS